MRARFDRSLILVLLSSSFKANQGADELKQKRDRKFHAFACYNLIHVQLSDHIS